MSTPYSRRPDVVAVVRAFLVSVRHRPVGELPRYGEVAQLYGGIAQGVAPVLNSIARECLRAGEPDLSALVVLAGSGLPGRLHGEVVDPASPSARPRWLVELQRIRSYAWPADDAPPTGTTGP